MQIRIIVGLAVSDWQFFNLEDGEELKNIMSFNLGASSQLPTLRARLTQILLGADGQAICDDGAPSKIATRSLHCDVAAIEKVEVKEGERKE